MWEGSRTFLFVVTKINKPQESLFNVALAVQVPPSSLDEKMNKSKVVAPTVGGFVEWIWPDDFSSVSASGSTGAFVGMKTGLTSADSNTSGNVISKPGRRDTAAYKKYEDLIDLFHMNGCVYDSNGYPAIRGQLMMIYDRGVYTGHFTSFDIEEDDTKQHTFDLSWEFKVENTLYKIGPGTSRFVSRI